MKKQIFIFLALILFPSVMLSAQSSLAYIIYMEGEGFSHIRNGSEHIYDLMDLDSENAAYDLELKEGDSISTFDNTFLEIQLYPSDNVIKISENTYFTLSELDGNGTGSFDLDLYKLNIHGKF